MIERGNHNSVQLPTNEQSLEDSYKKEVKHGWMMPTTIESILKLDGAAVIPIGVAIQSSIDAKGDHYTKRRTTHDASFQPASDKSINSRLIREDLEPCFFCHCLLRLLHALHSMRLHDPQLVIFLIKYDLDAAYRRLHVMAKMAALAITILKNIAYILLRLPFGVANGPSDYCIISKPVIDLANDILRDENGIQTRFTHLYAKNSISRKQETTTPQHLRKPDPYSYRSPTSLQSSTATSMT